MEKSYFCEAGTVDEPCNWKFKSSKNFLNHMEKEHNITNAELPFPKKNKFELDSETKEQNENGIFYFCKGGTPAKKCNRKYTSAKSWLYHMEKEHRITYIALPLLENNNNAKATRRITNHKIQKQKSENIEMIKDLELKFRVLSRENKELSFKKNDVKQPLEELKNMEHFTGGEILDTGVEKCIDNEMNILLIPSEHTSLSPLEKINNDKKQKSKDIEMIKKVKTQIRVFSDEIVEENQNLSSNINEVKRLLEELKSRGRIFAGEILAIGTEKCIVCIDNEADTAILPCGHVNFCLDCADSLKNKKDRCPICRSPIKYTQRIFF